MPRAHTNGIDTYYDDTGEGPAVIFIHGHSADLRMWKYQVDDVVAAGFRIVRYDVRGHGRSQVPDSGYTWANYAADLTGLLDRLSIDQAHIVGSSMGGAIALALALQQPDRVPSLTLVDSALPGFTYSPEFSDHIQALVAAVRAEGPAAAFERLWLSYEFFDGVRRHPERFAELRETVLSYPAAEYRAGYQEKPGQEQLDISERLHEVGAPTLVIVGEHDIPDFQLIAEIASSTMPNARKEVIESAWHLPSVERPEVFNPLLIDFLCGVLP